MTQSLAVEWGRYGIRLNAIAPGLIPTEGMSKRLTPGQGRRRERQAIRCAGSDDAGTAEPRSFLMADGCEWLTGETIALDGAQACHRRQFHECSAGATPSGSGARGDRGAERARQGAARLTGASDHRTNGGVSVPRRDLL